MKILLFILATGICSAQCTTVAPGICNTGLSPIQNNLLGPLTPTGSSPWAFGDPSEQAIVNNMAPAALAEIPTLGPSCPGTVSWTQGTNTVTTTSDISACISGKGWLVLAWNSIDGAGTGRAQCPISSYTFPTLTCAENLFEPTSSGVTSYTMPAADVHGWDFQAWVAENPSVTWNYYGADMGIDRLYYRSLNSTYHTYAQQYQDITWQWTIDHGYRFVSPRAAPLVGQVFRALEGHSERFPGLYNWMTNIQRLWADPSNSPAIDNREAGYAQMDIASLAKTDTDPTRHAQYCSWLSTYTNTWNTVQAADGSWPEEEYALNPSYVAAPKTFSNPFLYPGAPWREAINVKAMESAYESLADTTSQGCNQPTLAAATLTAITNAVTWQWNYGRDNVDRGVFYEVNSQSADQNTVYPGAGTVAITNGSTALVGTGTNFLAECTANPFVGLQTPRTIYKFASCADDTHATLTKAYGLYGEVGNLSGSPVAYAPAAYTSCPSSATYCFGQTGDRNLERTVVGDTAWLYGKTLNPTYLAWTNELLSAELGGPTAGLTSAVNIGSVTLPCSGPACDGLVNDTWVGAPNCGDTSNVPPCQYGGLLYLNLGKNFGEAFGAPAIDNALAYRLYTSGGTPPVITTTSPLPSGTVGTPYSVTFGATGTLPITWNGTGIPSWSTLSSGGILAGTPNAAATTTFNVKATNSVGNATLPFSLTIGSALTCDLNHDNRFDVLDVRLMTNQVLGITVCTNNLTQTGMCNVTDIQRVTNAALLFANGQPVVCPTGP